MTKSGYTSELKYLPPMDVPNKRVRRRNIIWFNPPFNMNVKTNVAAMFLKLIDKHFPLGSPLRKYFNRSTVKVSYSTTKNMKAHLDKHNRQVLKPKLDATGPSGCNCRNVRKEPCPLD